MKQILVVFLTAALLAGCSTFHPPKRVAIMDFEVATSDPQDKALSFAVPEYLMGYMVNAKNIFMVERQDMNRYLGAHYGENRQRLIHDRWQEIGRRLNVDYFIAGSVSQLENNLIVNARLFSVARGEVVPSTSYYVSCARPADLYPRMKKMAQWFAYQIQGRQPPSGEAQPPEPGAPK